MWTLHIPNDCFATEHLSFLVWGDVRATTGKLQPGNCLQKCLALSVIDFWGFCSIISGIAHTVRPYPDNWTHATVSKQKFDCIFCLFTWPWRPIQWNRRHCCASRYLLELLNVIAPILKISCCDYSKHRKINSAWKLLVASCVCVCVAEARTHIFNRSVTSAKLFISSTKTIRR